MEPTAPEVNVMPEMGSLARGRLGTWGIVFLVFAAMTPLVGLTSTTGLAMSLGDVNARLGDLNLDRGVFAGLRDNRGDNSAIRTHLA